MTTTIAPELRRFRCTTDRIGRTHRQVTLTLTAADADDLAEQLYRACRPHLRSSDPDVTVDLTAGKAWILGGRAGTFTIEELHA